MSHTNSVEASVVIPSWEGIRYLPACLDAVLAQEHPNIEVIVVDNASTDGSADFVAQHYPQVRVLRNQANLGFAGACNIGMRAAQGEILVLLNQDAVVRPRWICALMDGLQNLDLGVAGCKILYPDGKTIQHAGGWIEWPLGLSRHYGQHETDHGQWDTPRQVEYVTGAAMAVRRDVLVRVGFLDEGFWPGYYEDTDFCFTARKHGYRIGYVPDAVLVHYETTSTTDWAFVAEATQRGRLRFLLKHMPLPELLRMLEEEEQTYYLQADWTDNAYALRMAYLEAIPTAAAVLPRREDADRQLIGDILAALQELCMLPLPDPLPARPMLAGPVRADMGLHEFEFRSEVPLLGPLISGLRRLWYGVAARWAMRALIQQQEAINRQQAAINQWQAAASQWQEAVNRRQSAMDQILIRAIGSLSREVANASLRLESEQGNAVQEKRFHER